MLQMRVVAYGKFDHISTVLFIALSICLLIG